MEFAQIQTVPEIFSVIKVLITGLLAFVLAFIFTPIWTNILFKYRIGIKIKTTGVTGDQLTYVSKLHAGKSGTPTMGGVIVWLSVLVLVLASHLIFPLLSQWWGSSSVARLDFLGRKEVWLPLFVLVASGFLGLLDDWMSVRGYGSNKGGGMRFLMRFWWLTLIAASGAWWFYSKLGWDRLHVPAIGDFSLGWWYIPLFMFVIIFTAISSNETDGLDGLNGGVLLIAFTSFAFIAFSQNKLDLAAFCAALAGALLAFLWFNVYPARFFMGDTGAMALGTTLGVVAMLTNSVVALLFIVFIYLIESGSVIIQLSSKRWFRRKVFLAAPLHHHFEAKGWPEPKIVMRAWIFTMITALIGVIIAILGKGH
jgi:phospho-N-acetylmuramoyl-pentapeptide-transferase